MHVSRTMAFYRTGTNFISLFLVDFSSQYMLLSSECDFTPITYCQTFLWFLQIFTKEHLRVFQLCTAPISFVRIGGFLKDELIGG